MITKKIEDFILKNNILFAVIFDLEKRVNYTLGDKSTFTYDGLYDSLFGDEENILRLNESLEGRIIPHSWKQGELKCLVVKPNDNIIMGLFYNDHQNAIESYKTGKRISNEMIEIWNV